MVENKKLSIYRNSLNEIFCLKNNWLGRMCFILKDLILYDTRAFETRYIQVFRCTDVLQALYITLMSGIPDMV